MPEKLYKEKPKNIDQLDPMTCQLGILLYEQLRYTSFMSTKELQKLKTCSNLSQMKEYIEIEKNILEKILGEDPKLKRKKNFHKLIAIEQKNFELLKLIQDFVSIDYLRLHAKEGDEANISGLMIYIKKDSKGSFYISNISINNKE